LRKKTRYFGLIGYPLGHSFSKKYFTEKFEKEGINHTQYELFPLSHIEALPELIRNTPGLAGLNVTIPHKQAVIPFLTALDDTARAIGAVNVISIRGNEWKGYNSDAIGFETTLRDWLVQRQIISITPNGKWTLEKPVQAYVLGTGGASKAVSYVLIQHHISFSMVSRHPDNKIGHLGYENLEKEMVADGYRLWINTTPSGTYPDVEQMPALPVHLFNSKDLVYDLIYNPTETRLMQQAQQQGATVMNGLPMLHGQAEAAWEIWNL